MRVQTFEDITSDCIFYYHFRLGCKCTSNIVGLLGCAIDGWVLNGSNNSKTNRGNWQIYSLIVASVLITELYSTDLRRPVLKEWSVRQSMGIIALLLVDLPTFTKLAAWLTGMRPPRLAWYRARFAPSECHWPVLRMWCSSELNGRAMPVWLCCRLQDDI